LVLDRGLASESTVALPPSDGSSGICTFSTGRFPDTEAELVRDGGVKPSAAEETETLRFLCVLERAGGGDFLPRFTAAVSTDCDRLFGVGAGSLRGCSAFEVDEAQCCERIDRDSSIGVKILLDLTDIRFTGSSICCCGGCGSSCS
jgi:hypothetical protein